MAIRKLLATATIIGTGLLVAIHAARGEPPTIKPIATSHSSTDDTATIRVAGLKRPVLVLHVSDAHVSVEDKGEEPYRDCGSRMDKAYGKPRAHYRTKLKALPAAQFLELMALAKNRRVDLIALGGDIVNNPSQASVEFVQRVKSAKNLIAVLAGHLHRPRADQLSPSAVQYLTRAACDGGHRLIAFEPPKPEER